MPRMSKLMGSYLVQVPHLGVRRELALPSTPFYLTHQGACDDLFVVILLLLFFFPFFSLTPLLPPTTLPVLAAFGLVQHLS